MRLLAICLMMIATCASGQDNTDLMYRVVRAPNRAKARALLGITNVQSGSLNLSNWANLTTNVLTGLGSPTSGVAVAVSGTLLGARTNGSLVTISNKFEVQQGSANLTNWSQLETNVISSSGVNVAVAGSLLGAQTNGSLVTISNRYEAQAGNQNITNWGTISTNNLGKQVAVAGGFLVAFTNGNLVTLSNLYTPQVSVSVTNKTVTNTWIGSNITDSNVTTVFSFVADGSIYNLGWSTHMMVLWDGIIDAFPELKTWAEYTDVYNITSTNLMFDLLPFSQQFQSYHIENTYTAGGNARPNYAANTDIGWTAGQALLKPASGSTVVIKAQRIGSYAGLISGGITNVAFYTVRNQQ